jgi:hypothetical protein
VIAIVEGTVLEVIEQEREGQKVRVARVFQPGEKSLLSIPLDGKDVDVGDFVQFKVRVIPYAQGREKIPSLALRVVE